MALSVTGPSLHLGCGHVILPGWINADIQDSPGVAARLDARALPFPDRAIGRLYACALIEHLSRWEWSAALAEWYRVLQPGGTLFVSTGDFQAICKWYGQTGSMDHLLGLLVGGQRDPWDRHGVVFDHNTLARGLERAGFVDVQSYNWRAFDVGRLGIDDYSQAYMPHMDKERGMLMVLNLRGTRPRWNQSTPSF
jgi:predicted SAM-dependent methyltransferase